MRETEFDNLRWIIYGIVLVVLAVVSFAFQPMLWAFAVLLLIAAIDIVYVRYFKGRVWR
ncbi:MAG: hypothetical protein NTY99_02325 [DPANN group archaeon]|jgi:uncharacterized membrane protein|nr:hypothetical protein [DPANN group archaeon]